VSWDVQDVLPEDIERIEVISGPGATLWGANAVNGVINITRANPATLKADRCGLGAATSSKEAAFNNGGRLSDELSYRAYVDSFRHGHDVTATARTRGTIGTNPRADSAWIGRRPEIW